NVESLSVMEGDSVTLHTGVTKIQRDDQILWKFEDRIIPSIRLNSTVDSSWSNVNLNDKTGDLTIKHIQSNQSGIYKLEVNII
ncbi:hypothetical protein M9458_044730, partial [Cirrhinus mrigala]